MKIILSILIIISCLAMKNIDIQKINGRSSNYLDSASMAEDQVGAWIDISQMDKYSFQSTWIGSPQGDVIIEESNDASYSVIVSTVEASASTISIVHRIDIPVKYTRLRYDSSSGSGSMTTKFFSKGP